MEVSFVDKCSYLFKLSKTERKFVHEIAFAHSCTSEKILGDLMFGAIFKEHAEIKLHGMLKTQGVFWVETGD